MNPSGIAGVDNPLRDDTLYYKKNLDKLKDIVKKKHEQSVHRKKNLLSLSESKVFNSNKPSIDKRKSKKADYIEISTNWKNKKIVQKRVPSLNLFKVTN